MKMQTTRALRQVITGEYGLRRQKKKSKTEASMSGVYHMLGKVFVILPSVRAVQYFSN